MPDLSSGHDRERKTSAFLVRDGSLNAGRKHKNKP